MSGPTHLCFSSRSAMDFIFEQESDVWVCVPLLSTTMYTIHNRLSRGTPSPTGTVIATSCMSSHRPPWAAREEVSKLSGHRQRPPICPGRR